MAAAAGPNAQQEGPIEEDGNLVQTELTANPIAGRADQTAAKDGNLQFQLAHLKSVIAIEGDRMKNNTNNVFKSDLPDIFPSLHRTPTPPSFFNSWESSHLQQHVGC